MDLSQWDFNNFFNLSVDGFENLLTSGNGNPEKEMNPEWNNIREEHNYANYAGTSQRAVSVNNIEDGALEPMGPGPALSDQFGTDGTNDVFLDSVDIKHTPHPYNSYENLVTVNPHDVQQYAYNTVPVVLPSVNVQSQQQVVNADHMKGAWHATATGTGSDPSGLPVYGTQIVMGKSGSTYSSSSSVASSGSGDKSASVGKKRKLKKYEMDNDDDPSVKGAKVAKFNRDKKKQQLEKLAKQLEYYENELAKRRSEMKSDTSTTEQLRKETQALELQLAEERKKRGSSVNALKMTDYIRSVLQTLNPAPTVSLSNNLANMPVPTREEVQEARRQMAANGNIPGPAPGYLIAKISLGDPPTIYFDIVQNNESQPQN